MRPSEIIKALKLVADVLERIYVEGGDLAGWLTYALENLDAKMDKPEFEPELRKLRELLDERLKAGRW